MAMGQTRSAGRLSRRPLTCARSRIDVAELKRRSAQTTSATQVNSAVLRKIKLLAVTAFAATLIACNVESDGSEAVPASSGSATDPGSTVGTPIPLPFENPFPGRWNPSNNGSPYEPCVAFSDGELSRFGIDPSVIEDAAIVSGQGVRGCSWLMEDRFAFSNLVTNSQSLATYRSGLSEYDWHPDFEIGGRTVGLFSMVEGNSVDCATYVQSFTAAVITTVVTSSSAEGQTIDACKLAVDFTRAYIDKIPG